MLIYRIEHRDGTTLEMRLNAGTTWPDAIDQLIFFLRGAGYIIPNDLEVTLEEPSKDDDNVDNT